MGNCNKFKDRFIECMFTKSELVQNGASIGEAIRTNNERNFPRQCYEIYTYYRKCLNEIVNFKARFRQSELDKVDFDDDGNLIYLDEPDLKIG